mmetsp:Transcript_22114/g.63358  ORF Transcript_22114/g.63358 Transcript_22114/m.63358 type:complete len:549 (+) Transcript_22114:58-1704(+)
MAPWGRRRVPAPMLAALSRTLVASVVVGCAWRLAVASSACPCCDDCALENCPCSSCPTCTRGLAQPKPSMGSDGVLMHCKLNCYNEAAKPVPLPGGTGQGVVAETVEDCRSFCMATPDCEAIVYGTGQCWGKKDVRTSKCQLDEVYVTEMVSRMPFGTCTVLGDPHIFTFDDPHGQWGSPPVDVLRAGDYELVVSDEVIIHGRFGYSSEFPSAASLTGLAVSGSLLNHQKLVVEYTGEAKGRAGFSAWWDGKRILDTGFPATFTSGDGFLSADLNDMDPDTFSPRARHTIGGTAGNMPSFLFRLVPDINIYALLGEETMNAVIIMRRLPGAMDGLCGNFDCDSADDTKSQLRARGGDVRLSGDASLFQSAPPPLPWQLQRSGDVPAQAECEGERYEKAAEVCKAMPEDGRKAACIFDVCASGKTHAGTADAMASALAGQVEKLSLFSRIGDEMLHLDELQAHSQIRIAAMALMVSLMFGGVVVRLQSWHRADMYMEVAQADDEVDETFLRTLDFGFSRRAQERDLAFSRHSIEGDPDEDHRPLEIECA